MSVYPDLIPIFASSIMHVSIVQDTLKFYNTITYDYLDEAKSGNYYDFLKIRKNFNQEIDIAWENLQKFLDQEHNSLNKQNAPQKVKHCNIYFRDNQHPFIQWIVEFEGNRKEGNNEYINLVAPEHLTYPIYSLYYFHKPLKILEIYSSLTYNLNERDGIIEYYGETGDELEGEEKIVFRY